MMGAPQELVGLDQHLPPLPPPFFGGALGLLGLLIGLPLGIFMGLGMLAIISAPYAAAVAERLVMVFITEIALCPIRA